jgi:protoporphyrinogen oxidase
MNNNGTILLNTSVIKVDNKKELSLTFKNSKGKTQTEVFDKIIFTTPSFTLQKICALPQNYINKIQKLNSLGAINLVLRLKKPFFNDNTYWLSVCDINSPIMAIVEHTKFMDKKYYNNEHIVYLGNYKPNDDIYFSMDKSQLLDHFDSYLNKINSNYRKNLISYEIFKSSFAQPIIYTNYSKFILPFETPIKNVYLANMEQVYPWDRGTNYAVEIGTKIAKLSTE